VVLIGSVSEYSDHDEVHAEDEACWPATPYGMSKLMATLRSSQLASQYGIKTRVARLFLPFGPLDNPSRIMAEVPRRLRRGESVQLSPCEQRRDLLYIVDACRALDAMVGTIDRGVPFEVFNICSGTSPRLRDVVLHIAARLGADPSLCRFGDLPLRPGEPAVMAGSPAKAMAAFGWKPDDWKGGVDRYLSDLEAESGELEAR
jgi:nucleoside-diphosphate-sugar epimerase